jgi:predicted ATP-dependent serine protease
VSVVRWRCVECQAEFHGQPPPSCSRCFGGLAQLADAWAGRALDHAPRKPKIVSALGLRATAFSRIPASPLWRAIFGKPELPAGAVIGLSGIPSSGKSTLALRLCEDGAHQRPLFAAAEEGLSVGLADRAARTEATRTSFCDARNIPELLEAMGHPDESAYDLVVIDSITSMGATAADLSELVAGYEGLTVLAICQSRKDGAFKGSQQLLHEASSWIELGEARAFTVSKSWFGELREGVLPEPGEE